MQSNAALKNKKYRFSCTTERYNHLYRRYLKDPAKLLQMVDYQPHHQLLDLCGGTGAIANAALEMGANPANVTLLDLNPRCQNKQILQLKGSALPAMQRLAAEGKQYDRIICRQAFAYLNVEGKTGVELAKAIALLCPKNGIFIFNSFIRPRFSFKTYSFCNQRFFEFVGFIRRHVFRLQVNLKFGYDMTISKWHREERIYEIFTPFFDIKTVWSKNAIYWICTPR